MRVRGKKRSNYFKLGRRGRRGRVAYDSRWGHFAAIPRSVDEDVEPRSGVSVENMKPDGSGRFSKPRDGVTTYADPVSSQRPDSVMATMSASVGCEGATCCPQSPHSLPIGDDPGNVENVSDLGAGTRHIPETMPGNTGDRSDSCVVGPGRDMTSKAQDGVTEDTHNIEEIDRFRVDDVPDDAGTVFADELQPVTPRVALLHLAGVEEAWEDDSDGGDASAGGEVEDNPDPVMDEDEDQHDDIAEGAVHRCVWSDKKIMARFRKISQWQNMLSLLFVTGTVRVSVQSYRKVQVALNTLLRIGFPSDDTLPAYSTVDRTLLPILRNWGYVGSELHTALLDTARPGVRARPNVGDQVATFRVVQPSAWSALDVSCEETWDILKCASISAQEDKKGNAFDLIDKCPIIRYRHAVLKSMSTFMFASGMAEDDRSMGDHVEAPSETRYELQISRIHDVSVWLSRLSVVGSDVGNWLTVSLSPVRTFLANPNSHVSDFSTVPRRGLAGGEVPAIGTPRAGLWYTGDYCTFLRVPDDVEEILVLVHHQALPGRFDRRLELVCIPYTRSRFEDSCTLNWGASRKVMVKAMRLRGHSFQSPTRTIPYNNTAVRDVSSVGRLEDGKPYVLDRILLYSDGFNQYSSKQGSAGGVYCLSLNYPPHLRRSRETVRVLGLTPPGFSTSEGLSAIIPDLVRSATTGMVTRNAEGEDVVLFLDVVGYVCDYHEVGHVLDVLGPTGSAPCHLCSFLRFDGPEKSGSRYGNTTVPNSADGCYSRTRARVEAVSSSNITDDELVSLGLNIERRAQEKDSPLIEFHDALKHALQTAVIPKTERNVPVVNPVFDPYRSVLVAPDHLLGGIAVNEITLAFKALPNNRRREQAERNICYMLQSNGLLQQSRIYNITDKYFYSPSTCSTFCTLLVAAPVFTEIVENLSCPQELSSSDKEFIRRLISNMRAFQKLVARTYWYPNRNADKPSSVKRFNDNDGITHIPALQDKCIEYITECDKICRISSIATKELDKPNMRRLLELYMHSISAMGHVRHFAELIFECAHQPLKRAMAHSDNRKSHLQAMKHNIADDWKVRLAAALSDTDGSDNVSSCTRSVLNILSGRQPDVMRRLWELPQAEDMVTDLVKNDLIKNVLGGAPVHMDRRAAKTTWVLSGVDDKPFFHPIYSACVMITLWRRGRSSQLSTSERLD